MTRNPCIGGRHQEATRLQSRDTDPRAESAQIDLLRTATPSRRAALAISLSESVIGLARRAIARQNPELSDRDVMLRFVAIHYGEALSQKVRISMERKAT